MVGAVLSPLATWLHMTGRFFIAKLQEVQAKDGKMNDSSKSAAGFAAASFRLSDRHAGIQVYEFSL